MCVSVALGILCALRMRHIVFCGLSGSTKSCHITSKTARFSKKKVNEYKMCFDLIYNFCLKHFSF